MSEEEAIAISKKMESGVGGWELGGYTAGENSPFKIANKYYKANFLKFSKSKGLDKIEIYDIIALRLVTELLILSLATTIKTAFYRLSPADKRRSLFPKRLPTPISNDNLL